MTSADPPTDPTDPDRKPWVAPKIVTTVDNEIDGTIICGRLTEAGIRHHLSGIAGRARGGVRNVYVEESDLDRAREILKESEGFSEAELARLSEEALQRVADDQATEQ